MIDLDTIISPSVDEGTAAGQLLFWDGSTWTNSEVTELLWDDINKRFGLGEGTPLAKLHINGGVGSLSTGLVFGDGNTGIYENPDNTLIFTTQGFRTASISPTWAIKSEVSTGGGILRASPTNIVPSIVPNNIDSNSGIGWAGADQLSLIAGGAEGVRVNTTNVDIKTHLNSESGQTVNVTTVNAATYDLLITDYILNVTYTGTGAVTSLTLPTAQTTAGRTIKIKDAGGNAGTNNITIDTEGSELIDGDATKVIHIDYTSLTLYSDGSNWFIT